MKTYQVPKFSKSLVTALNQNNMLVYRNSKNVIHLAQYNKPWRISFHINFTTKKIEKINLIMDSKYSSVTSELPIEVFNIISDFQKQIEKLLQADKISIEKTEQENN